LGAVSDEVENSFFKNVRHALAKPGQVEYQHINWPRLDIDKASSTGETQTQIISSCFLGNLRGC
jgi:hypothetical protein